MNSSSPVEYDFDLIVIGAGPAGENAADYAVKHGLRVAIVESELVGGECSYWACMPSKALLRSGQALNAARRLPGAKQAITGDINAPQVLARRDSFASHWDDSGQTKWLASAEIELIRGRGEIIGPHLVQVGKSQYSALAVVLATGSVPVLPNIAGLVQAKPWGTREATAAQEIPARLTIIGAGVAGTELAFAFAALGSQVTMLSRRSLMSREEPFVGEYLTKALADAGVQILQGLTPDRVDRDAAGVVSVQLNDGRQIFAEQLLVSTGRRANTANLGLEALNLDPTAKLNVDDSMLVEGFDWLYAVGDVNSRAALTHQGKYQARIAGEAIAARRNGEPLSSARWGSHVASADHVAVPRVIFSDPQVAAVGMTEAEARAKELNVRCVEYELGAVAGASLHADGYQGQAKLVVDQSRQVIIGATFVGHDVAELLHAATIAIVGEVAMDRLWHAVPAYPTISEIWLRLMEEYHFPASNVASGS
ncbi:NAD(P)/FAD-dependent oxidoreductase [Arthrobacter sp. MYb213]|uniref:dihydrolipoyl dehydrogenase family protein n=1 Tax=Arthrobacter sp. MYb213 TaxID=1848595 RepID=UPI000CFB9056|nr:NAD(P)/FAD-dependent oxidoreductase [Arthrobacter sp. MYb213]PRB72561.1 pyridine nucleotide-disulfide oxidoreductase [Arthrobacter sp. MYb213]